MLSFDPPIDRLHPFTISGVNDTFDILSRQAYDELQHKVETLSDGASATWGFFPELQPELKEYSACVKLQEWFDKNFLTLPALQPFVLRLAFIRLAISEPQSSFGGLHIDASAGIDHLPPKHPRAQSNSILRVLINLYSESRELQYSPEDVDSLRAKGIDIPKDHYKIIELPQGTELRSYFVRPREASVVHGVMFESNTILHAGRTNQKGHFLLSYGSYADARDIKRLFS